ncbi:MAG: hypothetical protein HON66_02005 [Formosa sp.]|jgi:hypothetical protein|nr:hypothetical protein [Formosa sp.]
MNFTIFINKISKILCASVFFAMFISCGSFQYSGTYDDGIYNNSNSVDENQNEINRSSNSSEYYKNYFKEKSLSLGENSTTFTDTESYEGDYKAENTDTENYAGWGQNNSKDITINIYDTTPFYGFGWGSQFFNNWNGNRGWNMGWNMGWSNYGHIMDPFGNYYGYQMIPWGYNQWSYGFPNYGYYGFPNFGYGNFYGYGNFSRNQGTSVSYVNGPRGSRYSNNASSRRSVSNSSTLKKLTTRSNTSSRNLEQDITSKFGMGSVEHVEYIIKRRKENLARKDNGASKNEYKLTIGKKRKENLARQNTKSSKKESPFPKAVKRPSINRSYSSPSTTRSGGASSGRISGGNISRRKR